MKLDRAKIGSIIAHACGISAMLLILYELSLPQGMRFIEPNRTFAIFEMILTIFSVIILFFELKNVVRQ